MSNPTVHVVVMGVSGTGKTVVGTGLAERLGFEFLEGDSYHPASNVHKMESGIPLDDADREPWLHALADLMAERHRDGCSTVLTCSALKRAYRDVIRVGAPAAFFVHLQGDFDLLFERMSHRTKHFMPSSLLHSQFETLEPLQADESGVALDVAAPIDDVIARAGDAVRASFDLS
jgi:gluconokinase